LTSAGHRFLLTHLKTGNENVLIFCSDIQLRILANSKRWHSDGTFDCAPEMFYQLYIIHARYKKQMLPCVYALLSHKTESIYKQLLGFLKEGAIKLGLRLNPQIVLTDFEIAAQNAYEFSFPGIRLIGCFFSFRAMCDQENSRDWLDN
jgi:hypothetical protein